MSAVHAKQTNTHTHEKMQKMQKKMPITHTPPPHQQPVVLSQSTLPVRRQTSCGWVPRFPGWRRSHRGRNSAAPWSLSTETKIPITRAHHTATTGINNVGQNHPEAVPPPATKHLSPNRLVFATYIDDDVQIVHIVRFGLDNLLESVQSHSLPLGGRISRGASSLISSRGDIICGETRRGW
jgi:hypothetical protein